MKKMVKCPYCKFLFTVRFNSGRRKPKITSRWAKCVRCDRKFMVSPTGKTWKGD